MIKTFGNVLLSAKLCIIVLVNNAQRICISQCCYPSAWARVRRWKVRLLLYNLCCISLQKTGRERERKREGRQNLSLKAVAFNRGQKDVYNRSHNRLASTLSPNKALVFSFIKLVIIRLDVYIIAPEKIYDFTIWKKKKLVLIVLELSAFHIFLRLVINYCFMSCLLFHSNNFFFLQFFTLFTISKQTIWSKKIRTKINKKSKQIKVNK